LAIEIRNDGKEFADWKIKEIVRFYGVLGDLENCECIPLDSDKFLISPVPSKKREKQSSVAHRQHKNSTYFPHAKLTFSGKAHAPKSNFPNRHSSIWKVKIEIKFRENSDFLAQNSVGFQISTVQVLISRYRNALYFCFKLKNCRKKVPSVFIE
jgi:hypothetical protein